MASTTAAATKESGDGAVAPAQEQLSAICVFCGSAMGTRPEYEAAAVALGQQLVAENIRLVYVSLWDGACTGWCCTLDLMHTRNVSVGTAAGGKNHPACLCELVARGMHRVVLHTGLDAHTECERWDSSWWRKPPSLSM